MPGPTWYEPTKKERGDRFIKFGTAARRTGFEMPNHVNPGPGDYNNKRMFDNKVIVDYTKRGCNPGYATA